MSDQDQSIYFEAPTIAKQKDPKKVAAEKKLAFLRAEENVYNKRKRKSLKTSSASGKG